MTTVSTVPNVVFKTRVRDESLGGDNPFRWHDVSSADIFAGKKVIVVALPGAFTPTCSSTHLPGFEAKYEEFKALGVDEIYCLSVNDAFTMFQWGKNLGVSNIKCCQMAMVTSPVVWACWLKKRILALAIAHGAMPCW